MEYSENMILVAFLVTASVTLFLLLRIYKLYHIPAQTERVTMTDSTDTQQRPISAVELADATGEEGKALYVAVKDPYSTKITVFDVSSGKDYYGPGGPYHVFVGKDATLGLATTTVDPEKVSGDISALTESEKDTHVQWHTKYTAKYRIAGHLVTDDVVQVNETESIVTSETKKDA